MTILYVREGTGFREASAHDVLARAQALMAQRLRVGAPVLNRPDLVRSVLKMRLGALEYEVFGLIHVDARYRLIAVEDLFRGTLESAMVHPREVLRSVLTHNSAAVLLYHNHPSGVAEPSMADELITQRLKEVLGHIDVRVVDHLIVGEPVYSFAEHGRL